jgi:amidohydrolase
MSTRDAQGTIGMARELAKDIVKWRRHLHAHPETGTETPETAAYIAAVLRELGIEVRTGVGGHGVVGVLRGSPGDGRHDTRTIAVRADIDALNVQEETGLEFASKVPGRMHACGHDGHVAIALGAATILSRMKDGLKGNVKFIFQPAEEGPGGAKPMIEDGALRDPQVDAIVGLHMGCLWNVPSGSVGVMPGAMMAAMDRFEILVKGKGGHGAMPHQTIDALYVGAQVVSALQGIASRRTNPLSPIVVTVGQFHSGSAFNIIPGTAWLEGTVRCLDEELRARIPDMIREVAQGVSAAMGAECEVKYHLGYPVVINDRDFTEFFAGVARDVLEAAGRGTVQQIPEPTMGGEDMAYYLREVPGTFFFLGSRHEVAYPHHNPKFDIDESTLPLGAALLAETARRWLER